MREFTDAREGETTDEIWFLQHAPVFTLGQAGRREHLLAPADIPVVHSDRGGQVTYHGPGQLVVYTLLDLRRLNIGIRHLVNSLEESVISMLSRYALRAERREKAPGVYVENKKISSIGLRVRSGCTYHGMSLNVDVDLEPFSRIDVCGYKDLAVTSLAELGVSRGTDAAIEDLGGCIEAVLGLQLSTADSRAPKSTRDIANC